MNLDQMKQKVKDIEKEYYDNEMSAADAESKLEFINQWLKENKRLVRLTELIPKSKTASGEFAYITKGKYKKYFGREPSHNILDKTGKRVRWEYALDEFTQELGYDKKYGSNASEMLRDTISLADEYKKANNNLKKSIKNAKILAKKTGNKFKKMSVHLDKREMVEAVQQVRSPLAISLDNAQTANTVVQFPHVDSWLNFPNRVDIRGIDTKRGNTIKKHIKIKPSTKPGIKFMR